MSVFVFVHHLVTMEWVKGKELDFKLSTHSYACMEELRSELERLTYCNKFFQCRFK